MLIPLKLYWYLGHGLKMGISFGYNPQIIFVTFFHKLNFVIFMTKVMDSRYTVLICLICLPGVL